MGCSHNWWPSTWNCIPILPWQFGRWQIRIGDFTGHDVITAIQFSADGQVVTAGYRDWRGPFRFSSLQYHREDGKITALLSGDIQDFVFSMDGKRLGTTGSGENSAKLWEFVR